MVAFGQLHGIGEAGQWNQAFDFKGDAETMALVGSRLLLPICVLLESLNQAARLALNCMILILARTQRAEAGLC